MNENVNAMRIMEKPMRNTILVVMTDDEASATYRSPAMAERSNLFRELVCISPQAAD
jgi:hypothetical protein